MKDFYFKPVERESDIEEIVAAWAENNGWVVRKMKYIGRRGAADRFFFGYGQIVMIEFKRPGDGRLSEGQVQEHRRLAKVGCPVHVFDTTDGAIAFLRSKM